MVRGIGCAFFGNIYFEFGIFNKVDKSNFQLSVPRKIIWLARSWCVCVSGSITKFSVSIDKNQLIKYPASTKNRNSFDLRKSKLAPNESVSRQIYVVNKRSLNARRSKTVNIIIVALHLDSMVIYTVSYSKSIRSGQKRTAQHECRGDSRGSGTTTSNDSIGTELRVAWKYAYVWIYMLHDALPNSHGRCYSTEDNTKIRNKNTKITCDFFIFYVVCDVCLCLTLNFVYGHWRDTTTENLREYVRNETVSLHCCRSQMCILTHTISVHNLKHVLFDAEAEVAAVDVAVVAFFFLHSTSCIFATHLHCLSRPVPSRPDSIGTKHLIFSPRSTLNELCWFCGCCFIGSRLAYLLCYAISDDCFHNAIVAPVDTYMYTHACSIVCRLPVYIIHLYVLYVRGIVQRRRSGEKRNK